MKTSILTGAVCSLAVLMAGPQAHAEMSFDFGGNIEMDTDVVSNRDGGASDDSDMGGRVKLIASGLNESDRGYVKGVGQVLLKKDGETGIDDVYVRFGSGGWGLQLGRFQGTELFSKGTDTVHNVIGSTNFYQAGAARGRMSDTGQIMFDYSTGSVKFELGTIWGESDDSTSDEDSISGIRPAVVWDATGDLRVTLGYETVENAGVETSGYGLYVRYATDAFALKMNYASGEAETSGATTWENTSYNVNLESGNFGIGYTSSEDEGGDSASTVYGRYLIRDLMGVESANAQIGISLAEADSVAEDEVAIRLRIFYSF